MCKVDDDTNVVRIDPTFWQAAHSGEFSPHLSPIERMVALLKQDDPNLCDHDAMMFIAQAHREWNWGGPKLVASAT